MFEKQPASKSLSFQEWKRIIIELEISRLKAGVFNSSIDLAYPIKIRGGMPRLTENLCCPIKFSLENKILRDLESAVNISDIYTMYIDSGGYKVFNQLNIRIFEESKTDKYGTLQYKGTKKPGLSPLEHDNTGFLLQSLLDFYNLLELILKAARLNNSPLESNPLKACIEQQTKIKKAQKRMLDIFSKEHPDLPKETIERTYYREKHPDYFFLDGVFTDLRPFINLTKNEHFFFDATASNFTRRS